jgi:hypothetical protein
VKAAFVVRAALLGLPLAAGARAAEPPAPPAAPAVRRFGDAGTFALGLTFGIIDSSTRESRTTADLLVSRFFGGGTSLSLGVLLDRWKDQNSTTKEFRSWGLRAGLGHRLRATAAFSLWPRLTVSMAWTRTETEVPGSPLPDRSSKKETSNRYVGTAVALPIVFHPTRFMFFEGGPTLETYYVWWDEEHRLSAVLKPYVGFGFWL